ncbi:MAG: ComEC/Rec2 family competence protein [Acidimicrobiia bacterium]
MVSLAGAVAAGALLRRPAPASVVIVVLAVAMLRPRWLMLLMAGAVLCSTLSARAWSGAEPMRRGAVADRVTLLTDPRSLAGAVMAEARLDGRHVELWGRGSSGRRLARVLAGERIDISGTAAPVPRNRVARARAEHIVGQVSLGSVAKADQGSALARSANRVRRLLTQGARTMPSAERTMYLGFVIGDDRDQPPDLIAAYRDTGLSHLTAVSGENVAFVLAVVGPLLRRLGARARLMVMLLVIVWFTIVTRAEPSVLRASTMAAIAAGARVAGRPTAAIRVLALTVIGLLLIDPLLVHSVGFALSLGATAGIVLLSDPIAQRLPGPRGLIDPLALSIAAQIGVLPVTLAVFGGVPLISPVANVLAAPAAGPIMTWGLTVGLLAGLAPGWLCAALQFPAVLLVRWITLVARVCAAIPVGDVRAEHLVPITVAAALMIARVAVRGCVADQKRRRGPRVRGGARARASARRGRRSHVDGG